MFHRHWEPNASLIQAFSSIFFLSYAKLNLFIFQIFLFTIPTNEVGEVTKTLVYYDPTVFYASKKHVYDDVFSLCVNISLFSTNSSSDNISNFTV